MVIGLKLNRELAGGVRMLIRLVALTGCLALGACGGMIAESAGINYAKSQSDVAEVRTKTEVKIDSYEGVTRVTGPRIYTADNIFGHFFLTRATVRDGALQGPVQLYVSAALSDWYFLDRAFSGGQTYPVTEISRDVVSCAGYGCSLREDIAVNLTLGQVQQFAKSGFSVKIQGNGGHLFVHSHANYWTAYLYKLRTVLRGAATGLDGDFDKPVENASSDGDQEYTPAQRAILEEAYETIVGDEPAKEGKEPQP